jgi:hypothetical protein
MIELALPTQLFCVYKRYDDAMGTERKELLGFVRANNKLNAICVASSEYDVSEWLIEIE